MNKIEERIAELMEALAEEYGLYGGIEVTLPDKAFRGLLNSLLSGDESVRVGRYNYTDFTWETMAGLVVIRRKIKERENG